MASVALRFLKVITIVAGIALVCAIVGLAVARAALPATKCAPTKDRIAGLSLETMTYVDVVRQLGCDGVSQQRIDYGPGLSVEDFSWRGSAWPYGRFNGRFINGRLHGTETVWLNVTLAK